MPTILQVILYVLGIFVAGVIGYFVRKNIGEGKIHQAEEQAKNILVDAQRDAESTKKDLLNEAKDEIHRLRNKVTDENARRQQSLEDMEKRLLKKEETIDHKSLTLEKKEEYLTKELEKSKKLKEEAEDLVAQRTDELQRVAGLTKDEGKQLLLNELEADLTQESALMIKQKEQEVKDEADKYARNAVALAIQRIAADTVAETTVSVVNLPNDEMKGRIIGREGRNIRAIEAQTGVDLIIDDTPEAVVLSCFDPIRREVAKIALERLVSDGRIHPTRIEDAIEKAQSEVDSCIKESGEQASYDTGIHGLHPELIKYLGRLKYRTSYGQNVLKHSVEVATIAGLLAEHIGADVKVAKRGGLLHDIGKSIDHEIQGPHVDLGVNLARKYHESEEVIHCIEAHHQDVEFKSVEAILVQAADAISAARPGARRETVESYIQRLEQLEEIANSFDGIEKSYAVQAGREVRIIVKPEQITEAETIILARDIRQKIENELDYPGQIKVNVIRETRSIDYAK